MNRLVLIGNGFDLAHGLKTSYKDFIYWYWKQRVTSLHDVRSDTSDDTLCTLEVMGSTWSTFYFEKSISLNKADGKELYYFLKKHPNHFALRFTSFFNNIHNSIETKGWVDIENEYYELLEEYSLLRNEPENVITLNKQLKYLQQLLTEYLTEINQQDIQLNKNIKRKIYEPIKSSDISIEATSIIDEFFKGLNTKDTKFWEKLLFDYDIIGTHQYSYLHDIEDHKKDSKTFPDIPQAYRLPECIMLLNFNYTKTVDTYLKSADIFSQIQIHGALYNPEGMIFGYGDEFDDKYKKLQALNNNECLTNIKTIKYQESDNYRKVLNFIESAPFQVCIMGHSCGNSDRTLLNTIFEHKNCISIKPYYYKKEDSTDNYIEIIQNISRNFKDMKLMRDRVVNKTYCEALTE